MNDKKTVWNVYSVPFYIVKNDIHVIPVQSLTYIVTDKSGGLIWTEIIQIHLIFIMIYKNVVMGRFILVLWDR